MSKLTGVMNLRISDAPVAVVDLETTGLSPGLDRVVEISVVRHEPGQQLRLVLDTLVNPLRPMGATEIHGITDADVARAPRFSDIAGNLLDTLTGCVVAAYNVYFDMRFLRAEFRSVGIENVPPHFCLMYMRPMLGLGPRCTLPDACRSHGIHQSATHVAASDAMACGQLLCHYLQVLSGAGVETYGDLTRAGTYRFLRSFRNEPLPPGSVFGLLPCASLCSRVGHEPARPPDANRDALALYWDMLRAGVADLDISDEELVWIIDERARLNLSLEQVRYLHARAFACVMNQFAEDKRLDEREVKRLRALYRGLSKLGWAPGE